LTTDHGQSRCGVVIALWRGHRAVAWSPDHSRCGVVIALWRGLLTTPPGPTEGLLFAHQSKGDLRSASGHGQETMPKPGSGHV